MLGKNPFLVKKPNALIGAGRSSSSLIKFLISNLEKEIFTLTIADKEIGHLSYIMDDATGVEETVFDVFEQESR